MTGKRHIKAAALADPDALADVLADLAEYLGDRPATDRDANRLYERVIRMLTEQEP